MRSSKTKYGKSKPELRRDTALRRRRRRRTTLVAILLMTQSSLALHGQSPAETARQGHRKREVGTIETGVASYYHTKFQGRLTASGEKYDPAKLTAAHNALPMGTRIKVTNLRNGKTVIVKVNDRLHYKNKRLVDLSRAAAARLGYVGRGLTKVKVEVLKK